MSRYVGYEERKGLRAAIDAKQVREVGGIEPCKEMKWLGWRVVEWNGKLYALIIDTSGDWDIAEEIERDQLHEYTE